LPPEEPLEAPPDDPVSVPPAEPASAAPRTSLPWGETTNQTPFIPWPWVWPGWTSPPKKYSGQPL
jgi:hypothetical protein